MDGGSDSVRRSNAGRRKVGGGNGRKDGRGNGRKDGRGNGRKDGRDGWNSCSRPPGPTARDQLVAHGVDLGRARALGDGGVLVDARVDGGSQFCPDHFLDGGWEAGRVGARDLEGGVGGRVVARVLDGRWEPVDRGASAGVLCLSSYMW